MRTFWPIPCPNTRDPTAVERNGYLRNVIVIVPFVAAVSSVRVVPLVIPETRVPGVMPVPETTIPTMTLSNEFAAAVTVVLLEMVQEATAKEASSVVEVTTPNQRP